MLSLEREHVLIFPPGKGKGGKCVRKEVGGVIGGYSEFSRQCVYPCVNLTVYMHREITHLLKHSCNYPKLCLVGPASIPVELKTIWAPSQKCAKSDFASSD